MTQAITRDDRGALVFWAYAALLGLTAPVVVFAHRGVAPILLAMGLIAAFDRAVWIRAAEMINVDRLRRRRGAAALAALFLLSLWAGVSGLWSPTPGAGALALNLLAPLAASLAVAWRVAAFSPRRRARLLEVLAGAVVVAAVLLLVEGFSGGALRDFFPPADQSPERFKDLTALGRGVTILAVLVFPLSAYLRWRTGGWPASVALVAAALIAGTKFTIAANVIAIVGAAAVFVFALWRPAVAVAAIAGAALITLIAAPLFAYAPIEPVIDRFGGAISVSWLQRLVVWKATAREAIACLPWGCGADAARALKESLGTVMLPGSPIPLRAMPTHPHQIFMQVWLELGLPGALLLGFAILAGARAVLSAETPSILKAAVAAAAATVVASSLIEASIWQVWRLSSWGLASLVVTLSYLVNRNGV